MTLVVAGVNAGKGWIVSDTLISGGTIQLRVGLKMILLWIKPLPCAE